MDMGFIRKHLLSGEQNLTQSGMNKYPPFCVKLESQNQLNKAFSAPPKMNTKFFLLKH